MEIHNEDPDTNRTMLPTDTVMVPRVLEVPDDKPVPREQTIQEEKVVVSMEKIEAPTQLSSPAISPAILTSMSTVTPDKTPLQQDNTQKSILIQSAKSDASIEKLSETSNQLNDDRENPERSSVITHPSDLVDEPSAAQAVAPVMNYKDLPIDVPLINISQMAQLQEYEEKLKADNLSVDLSFSIHSTILDLPSSEGQSQLVSTQKSTSSACEDIILAHDSPFNLDSPREAIMQSPESDTSLTGQIIQTISTGILSSI